MNLYPTTEGTLIKLAPSLLSSIFTAMYLKRMSIVTVQETNFMVKDKHSKPPTEACNDYKQVCDIGSCLVEKADGGGAHQQRRRRTKLGRLFSWMQFSIIRLNMYNYSLCMYMYVQQSRVEIEHFSAAYFDRITAFKALQRRTSVKGRVHIRWVNS